MADLMAIDTSVLIDQERGVQAATNCVASLLKRNCAAMHPMSRAEMVLGARDRRHLEIIQAMLSPLRLLPVRNQDFERALAMLESSVLAHQIEWPDCLIAATCLRLGLPVVTVNDRDFRMFKGLRVMRPY